MHSLSCISVLALTLLAVCVVSAVGEPQEVASFYTGGSFSSWNIRSAISSDGDNMFIGLDVPAGVEGTSRPQMLLYHCDASAPTTVCSLVFNETEVFQHYGFDLITTETGAFMAFAFQNDLVTVACDDMACSSVTRTRGELIFSGSFSTEQLRISSDAGDGFPAIIAKDSDYNVRIAKCGDAKCTTSTITTLIAEGTLPRYPEVSGMAADGKLAIMTAAADCDLNASPTSLILKTCSDLTCTAMDSTTVAPDVGVCESSFFHGINFAGVGAPINTAGLPYAFFFNRDDSEGYVVTCHDAACTTYDTQMVDQRFNTNFEARAHAAEQPPAFAENYGNIARCANDPCTSVYQYTIRDEYFNEVSAMATLDGTQYLWGGVQRNTTVGITTVYFERVAESDFDGAPPSPPPSSLAHATGPSAAFLPLALFAAALALFALH